MLIFFFCQKLQINPGDDSNNHKNANIIFKHFQTFININIMHIVVYSLSYFELKSSLLLLLLQHTHPLLHQHHLLLLMLLLDFCLNLNLFLQKLHLCCPFFLLELSFFSLFFKLELLRLQISVSFFFQPLQGVPSRSSVFSFLYPVLGLTRL